MGQFQLPVSKCINLPASPTSFSPSILLKDMSLLQLNSPCVMDLILFYIFRQISYQLVHLYLILFGIIYLSIGSLIATFKHILPSLKKKKKYPWIFSCQILSNYIHPFIVKHLLKNTHFHFLFPINFSVHSLLISIPQWKLLLLSSPMTPVSVIPGDPCRPHFIWLFSCFPCARSYTLLPWLLDNKCFCPTSALTDLCYLSDHFSVSLFFLPLLCAICWISQCFVLGLFLFPFPPSSSLFSFYSFYLDNLICSCLFNSICMLTTPNIIIYMRWYIL